MPRVLFVVGKDFVAGIDGYMRPAGNQHTKHHLCLQHMRWGVWEMHWKFQMAHCQWPVAYHFLELVDPSSPKLCFILTESFCGSNQRAVGSAMESLRCLKLALPFLDAAELVKSGGKNRVK